jgi:hypothetical protein
MAELSTFSYSDLKELENLESNLQDHNKLFVSSIVNQAGSQTNTILDFDAGIRRVSNIWKILNGRRSVKY